ncbi:hypothetical protein [Adlercreutzia caecimuris]|uniref:hypothetical protein n=1 Tax=Adlercreutzia caecimuris TaxID=671266 RepID=UPI001C3CE39A|nr:hypothetical protein [Adlercreutzia caecimuris]
MKKMLKKSACLLTAVALSATMVALPAAAEETHAAEKPYMKTLKLKWDLKKNKAVKSKEKIKYVGTKTVKVTVKNLKTTTLKNGKKKTTFTLVYTRDKRNFKPSKKQIHKIVNSRYESWAGGFAYALVDYETGIDLEKDAAAAKELGVKVKATDVKWAKAKKHKDQHGCWASLSTKGTAKVTVTYPAEYKGLCLGVWANNYIAEDLSYNSTLANERFWNGEKPFGKTTYYKKGKTNSHWMRIK